MRIILQEAGIEYPCASNKPIRTPEQAAHEAEATADSATECMTILMLNAKNGMRSAEIVSNGLLDSTLVHPREIFRRAIALNAAAIVCVHNHPSGDATPSAEDVRVTRQLVEAGKIIGIPVWDHVIIARDATSGTNPPGLRWVSMRESGLVSF